MMQALDELAGLVSAKFKVFKYFLEMIKLEARLAGLSVFPLLLNICMLLVILFTVWLTAMCLLGYGVIFISNSNILGIISILILNFLLFALLLKYLMFNLKKMSFEKTRQILSASGERNHHELTERSDSRNSDAGKEDTTPTV